jgi:long-chain acyl-CoA synthetase
MSASEHYLRKPWLQHYQPGVPAGIEVPLKSVTQAFVRMDAEGYFHFYDRSKDLIKHKGYSIFAKEVEDVLYGHPQVKAAGVIGVADASVGQRIKAIVVLQGEARGKVSEEEIKSYCRQQLAEYKVPHIVEFRGELPKTDVGKVSRRELREEAGA